MLHIPAVSEAEATGKVKAIFEEIKATRGLAEVPNFWKAIALNPDYLEATWRALNVVLAPGKLDRATKEAIAVAVSATNACDYCLGSHSDVLRSLGYDDEALMELMAVVGFFNMSNTIANALHVPYAPPIKADTAPEAR
jgi:AhpD family alkylhydroperoxidase